MTKKNYFEEMQVRLDKYGRVHKKQHRKAALKMIIWNVLLFFQPLEKRPALYEPENDDTAHDDNKNDDAALAIAMITSGGIGDHLLFANYVYCFMEKYGEDPIYTDVFFKDKFGTASHIFRENDVCRKYYEMPALDDLKKRYDLVLDLAGFPAVKYENDRKIKQLAPELMKYIEGCKAYQKYCRASFRGNAYGMSRLCELEGRKLIQRADVSGMLKMSQQYQYPLFIDEDEEGYLAKQGLKSKGFITIQTGCDVIYNTHVKLWPIEHYRTLVRMIKEDYPSLKIVQIGNSGERCNRASECTVQDMVGQTDLEQAKVLLKHSLLHIDIEGGMVHLRYALKGGTSIVLFGPTSVEFFGYDTNINLRSSVCNTSCYQLTEAWPTRCPKGQTNVPCMEALTPETVYEEFKKILRNMCESADSERTKDVDQ